VAFGPSRTWEKIEFAKKFPRAPSAQPNLTSTWKEVSQTRQGTAANPITVRLFPTAVRSFKPEAPILQYRVEKYFEFY